MAKYNLVIADEETNSELAFEIDTPIDNLTIFSKTVHGDFSNGAFVTVNAYKPLSLISSDNQISLDFLLDVFFSFAVKDHRILDSDQQVIFDVIEASNRGVAEAVLAVIREKGSYLDFTVTAETV